MPTCLADLASHRAVNFLSSASGKRVPFDFIVDGKEHSVTMRGSLAVRHADAYLAGCIAGLGLIQVPRYGIVSQLAAGTLCEVLADCRPPPMAVSLLYPHSRQLSPRVRVFVDWVVQRMRPLPVSA